RRNAKGIDLSDVETLVPLAAALDAAATRAHQAAPLVGGAIRGGTARPVTDPADRRRQVGSGVEAEAGEVAPARARAARGPPDWDATPADERARSLERAADLYEAQMPGLMALAIREAGKTIPDAVAEVREAVDFLRYYATQARADFARP